MLPAYIRKEVERRLFENGFRAYEGLAQWVRGQGYEISDDSLWRYGQSLQQRLAAVRLTANLAHASGELAEDLEPLMARALIAIAQQKALETLAEKEEVEPADLNAIANLTRAAIAQQRWAAELKAQGEQQHHPSEDSKCGLADKTQPSSESLRAIALLEHGSATALAPAEKPAASTDRPRKTSPDDAGLTKAGQRASENAAPVERKSASAGEDAVAARIQPELHRGSPRLTADLHASESAARFSNSDLHHVPASDAGCIPPQINADRRRSTQIDGPQFGLSVLSSHAPPRTPW